MNWSRRTVLAGLAGFSALAATRADADSGNAHDFSFTSIDSELLPLSSFDGKVLLVVNTASFCGFTGQYAGLQALWERYRDEGLVLLGVPSNDFGDQEPGSAAEIKSFCEVNFDIDFPLTEKQHVKGADAHPFYAWASTSLGPGKAPRWNFHKYLIDRRGELVGSFGTSVRPEDPALVSAIEGLLTRPVG